MPDLEERLKEAETDRRTRSQREIDALDASESGSAPAQSKKKKKKKKKPAENVGTGQSSFDLDGAIKKIQDQIAATEDPNLKARLKARIQALRDNAG